MNEEEIVQVAKILEEWNPLGEAANTIEQLDGYRYEAIDIISTIRVVNGSNKVRKSIEQVLTQAFSIKLNQTKLDETSEKVKTILNAQQ